MLNRMCWGVDLHAVRAMLGASLLVWGAQSVAQAAPLDDLAIRPWAVASVSPAHDDDSDLKAFAQAIGDARVVALGEQTHGGREEFLLKTRLLKYLHEKMGFEVLLLESGMYEVGQLAARMDAGEKLDDMASGNIFFMYANSDEGRGLLRYLDQQKAAGTPLALAGIDSQHSGALSRDQLLPGLAKFLQSRGSKLAEGPDWQTYSALAKPLFHLKREAPAVGQRASFYRVSEALQKELCTDTGDNARLGPQWWCQVVRSVQSQAISYWSGGSDYQRDNQMGTNAIWLADHQFAGKKTVIWGHTVHVGRGFQRSPLHLQAGEVMHRRWGDAYKVVQFSAARGKLLDFATMQNLDIAPLPANSLEMRLAGAGYALAGVAATQPVDVPQFTYEYATHPVEIGVQGKLGVNWDLLFFIDTIHPVRMSR